MQAVLERMTDVDSHEWIPQPLWRENFGQAADLLTPLMQPGSVFLAGGAARVDRNDIVGDVVEVTEHNVWTMKSSAAPGAISMGRRLEVMDAQGIERQLMFPSFGLIAVWLASAEVSAIEAAFRVRIPADFDLRAVGRATVAAYNDWVLRQIETVGGDRLRPTAIILTETLDQMMADAERMIVGGCRALWIPTGVPPGGLSPADRVLDPFWRLASEANVPVCSHVGGDMGFMATMVWGAIPEFLPPKNYASIEFPAFDPYGGCQFHLGSENFLVAMVVGGVFERHPGLRYGAIEIGAGWVGPLCERMDLWTPQFSVRSKRTMSMPPSEYIVRNVRVSPFYFEPVDMYLSRWPNLQDVYCYNSDYPHPEGGKHSRDVFFEKVAPFGEVIVEKFFRTNGEWLLPD